MNELEFFQALTFDNINTLFYTHFQKSQLSHFREEHLFRRGWSENIFTFDLVNTAIPFCLYVHLDYYDNDFYHSDGIHLFATGYMGFRIRYSVQALMNSGSFSLPDFVIEKSIYEENQLDCKYCPFGIQGNYFFSNRNADINELISRFFKLIKEHILNYYYTAFLIINGESVPRNGILTPERIRKLVDDSVFRRGEAMFRAGKVLTFSRGKSAEEYSFSVNSTDGQRNYFVSLTLTDNGIISQDCTCAYCQAGNMYEKKPICKHMIACLLRLSEGR